MEKVKLVIDDNKCLISGGVHRGNLDSDLSFFHPGRFFSPQYKKGFWDGRIRFLKRDRAKGMDVFPTGLLSVAWSTLQHYNVDIEDNRTLISAEPNYDLGKFDIRCDRFSYQDEALQSMLQYGRGVVVIPTGGGKTVVGGACIKSYGLQSVWFTDRLTLARQTRKSLEEILGEPVGILGDGEQDLQRVTVAMVQSCAAAARNKRQDVLDWLQKCSLLIGDEIHHLESDMWYNVLDSIPAPIRFGLSATPKMEDQGLYIQAQTGPVIHRVPMSRLVDAGVVVPVRVWCVQSKGAKIPATIDKKKTSFQTVYSEGIVHNDERNSQICDVAEQFAREKKPVLMLVNRINHGELLCKELSSRGLDYGWIHGKVPQSRRESLIEEACRFERPGNVAVTSTMGEGVDIPQLRVVVNATGTKGGKGKDDETGRLTMQIIGRGLRSAPDSEWLGAKEHFDYVDFADRQHRYLKDASIARFETLEAAGYGDNIKYWEEYAAG